MILDCDWSISVQLIPNRSAKICNNSAKSVPTVQNFITNLSDWHKFQPKYKF